MHAFFSSFFGPMYFSAVDACSLSLSLPRSRSFCLSCLSLSLSLFFSFSLFLSLSLSVSLFIISPSLSPLCCLSRHHCNSTLGFVLTIFPVDFRYGVPYDKELSSLHIARRAPAPRSDRGCGNKHDFNYLIILRPFPSRILALYDAMRAVCYTLLSAHALWDAFLLLGIRCFYRIIIAHVCRPIVLVRCTTTTKKTEYKVREGKGMTPL